MESFDQEEKTTRVLVLITDGESTEGDSFDAAKEAAEQGILIYTIGMGSPAGAPIPVYGSSGRQLDFKRDKMGKVVLSKLDEVSLEQIASIGNGKYYRSSSTQNELDEIYEDINALQKREFGTKAFHRLRGSLPVLSGPGHCAALARSGHLRAARSVAQALEASCTGGGDISCGVG